MSKLCAQCAHRRLPESPIQTEAAAASAGSAGMQTALTRMRSVRKREEMAEGAVYNTQGRGVGLLERPPSKYEWCAAKSEAGEGRYVFCDWWKDDTSCPSFERGQDVAPDGPGASVESSSLRRIKPLAVFAASSAPSKPASALEAPQRNHDWALPLGSAYNLRPYSRPMQDAALGPGSFQIDYAAADVNERPAIRGKGLAQTYLIFGGPGAGKTHYFKYLLSSLLAHERRPGCLLLDPKGALTAWLEDELKKLNRLDDLTILKANAKGTPFNVFGRDLPPKELGRLLSEVVLAGAPGIDEGWAVLVGDLLESAAVVIGADPNTSLTAAHLLNDILYPRKLTLASGKEVIDYPIRYRALRLAAQRGVQTDARISADRIREYFSSAVEPKLRRFVRQVIERSLAELALPEWAYLSSTETRDSPYSDIIENHAVVSVAVGQSSPAFQRSMSTLIKSLFQQAALSHLSMRTQGSSEKPNETPFYILACDEYAQAITEGQTGLVSDSRFFSLSREAGCLSLLALQSVATGRSRFPADMRDRWEGILGNVTVKFFMKLNDSETAEMASKLAGNQHSFVQVMSQQQSAQGPSNTDSQTMLEHPRVPPWYLTNRMPQGHAMVHGTLDGEAMPTSLFVRVPR